MKATILSVATAIGVVIASSVPASATTCPTGQIPDDNGFGCVDAPSPVSVPEPASILGIMAVGGAILGNRTLASKKADQ